MNSYNTAERESVSATFHLTAPNDEDTPGRKLALESYQEILARPMPTDRKNFARMIVNAVAIGQVLVEQQQPALVPTGTEAAVCADIASRQARGMEKYGVTVEDNPLPLRAWLEHAYQETLDKAIYLKRAIDEIDRAIPRP